MVSKRFAFALVLICALCVWFSATSQSIAQNGPEDGSPAAAGTEGTAVAVIDGQQLSPVNERMRLLPACLQCYFGVWELSLAPGATEAIGALPVTMMGFAVAGEVTLDPPSPSQNGPIAEGNGFLWLDGVPESISNQGATPATIYLAGIVPGSASVTPDQLTLLGGAMIEAQSSQNYSFRIGKLTLDDDDAEATINPLDWPVILSVTSGEVSFESAISSLPPDQLAVDTLGRDEMRSGVEVFAPSTVIRMSHDPGTGDASIWFIGVYAYEPTGSPGCGWRCRG